jgi:chorismate dehydratase
LPFRWALGKSSLSAKISLDIPSECARKLLENEADLALVPVAILPALGNYEIVSGYCIGADGHVDSVKLYSDVPPEQAERVLLDYQSRTSVALARILFRRHWKSQPEFVAASKGFEKTIGGTTAGVVIGDRTFSLNGKFSYESDLAEEWKKLTGLPFVFAAWVSRRPLDPAFIANFNAVLKHGVDNIPAAVKDGGFPGELDTATVEDYLTNKIDYVLDERKKEALAVFLGWLKSES